MMPSRIDTIYGFYLAGHTKTYPRSKKGLKTPLNELLLMDLEKLLPGSRIPDRDKGLKICLEHIPGRNKNVRPKAEAGAPIP